MCNRIKKLMLLLVIPWMAVSVVRAEVKLDLQVSDTSLVLGDEMTVQLKADGVEDNAALIMPSVPGLTFRQLGAPSSSSQTIIVNGKISRFSGLIYSIGISASKKGQFLVPGFGIQHQNQTFNSKSFTIRVVSPDAQSSMRVTLAASSEHLYPDEPLVITLKWYLQDRVQDYTFRFPLLEQKDRFQLELVKASGTATTRELVVNGYTIPFEQGVETVKGEQTTVYQTAFRIFPSDPGMLSIPAASVKAIVQRGTELKRDFFDRVIQTPKLERIFAVSKELQVQVAPLPAEGRPRSFTGGVGDFQIQLSTGQTRVRLGDPIELAIRITGKGRFSKIQQPVLNDIPEYKANFVVVDNLQPGDIQADGITFKQVVRPRNETVTRIPPVRFSFFNPEKKRYFTVESNDIPIKVLLTKKITAADMIVPDQQGQGTGNPLQRQQRGIYGNYSFEDALTTQTRSPAWFLLFLIPPLAFFIFLVIVQRRRRLNNDQALVRARAARGRSSRRLKKAGKLIGADSGQFLKALSLALSGYVSDKFNLGSGEVTVVDIRELAKKHALPEQLAEALVDHFERFDRLRFSHEDITPEEREAILTAVDQTIRDLNRHLQRP